MRGGLPALFLSFLLVGCGGKEPADAPKSSPASRGPEPAAAVATHPDLAAAVLEPSGYPTILYAPPAALGRAVPRRGQAPGMPDPAAATAVRTGRSAEKHLRIFPVVDRQMEPTADIAIGGTLQLRDGCLRIKPRPGSAEDEAIAVFPVNSRAFVDREGYLSVGQENPDFASVLRVGEAMIFGPGPPVTDQKLIAAVRKACGSGPLFWLKDPSSSYATQLNRAAWDAARAAEIHGVTVEVARHKMFEELQAGEAKRRRCTLAPDQSCVPKEVRPGARIESWLIVWPPPPPGAPKS
jgi:hypothetical protein